MPHSNQITWYRQTSTINSGALVDLSQPGTASARTGELLLGWDGRNKKSPAQGLGIVKGSLAQAGHLKCSFAAQKGSARRFRGETKEEFKTAGKNWKLFSISSHGFGSGLHRFKRSKQQQPEGANQRQHADKRRDESQRKLGQEADIGK